jgi:glutamate dehydrogenase/leucine dehydrogenase
MKISPLTETLKKTVTPKRLETERGRTRLRQAGNDFAGLLGYKPNKLDRLDLFNKWPIKRVFTFDEKGNHRALPVVMIFDGRVYENYDGARPHEIVYAWDNTFEAVTGIYGNPNLPNFIISKGGIRYYPFSPSGSTVRDRMLREATRLAETMNQKNPFWNVLFDGGKTIIAQKAEADKQKIIAAWTEALTRAGVLGRSYVAGPDMGMGEAEMEKIEEVYAGIRQETGTDGLYPTTGSSIKKGGFPHKEWRVTSTGVAEAFFVLQSMLPDQELNRVLIQGFGDVGGGLVTIFAERAPHTKICGVSDINAAIYDPEGLNLKVLGYMAREGLGVKDYVKAGGKFSGRGRFLEDIDELPFQEADVFLPAACAEVITRENSKRLKVKAIVEGANNSVGRGLEKVLHKMGIIFIPGAAANGGGIFTSTREMLHRYFDGQAAIVANEREYRNYIVGSVREFAFASMRALLRESFRKKISSSALHERWSEKLIRENYRLAELVARIDRGEIITHEFHQETKNSLLEIYRRTRLGRKVIPDKFNAKFAIQSTVREMVAWLYLYDTKDVLKLMVSKHEADRREAAFVLGRIKDVNEEAQKSLGGALKDRSAAVRRNAAESIGLLGLSDRHQKRLETMAQNDPHEEVKLMARWVLSGRGMF